MLKISPIDFSCASISVVELVFFFANGFLRHLPMAATQRQGRQHIIAMLAKVVSRVS